MIRKKSRVMQIVQGLFLHRRRFLHLSAYNGIQIKQTEKNTLILCAVACMYDLTDVRRQSKINGNGKKSI